MYVNDAEPNEPITAPINPYSGTKYPTYYD